MEKKQDPLLTNLQIQALFYRILELQIAIQCYNFLLHSHLCVFATSQDTFSSENFHVNSQVSSEICVQSIPVNTEICKTGLCLQENMVHSFGLWSLHKGPVKESLGLYSRVEQPLGAPPMTNHLIVGPVIGKVDGSKVPVE